MNWFQLNDRLRRLEREIERLVEAISVCPYGRYTRALEARQIEHAQLIAQVDDKGATC